MSPLRDEFQFFLANREDLLRQYPGKVIVIKGHKVIGVYDSKTDAVEKTKTHHEMGTFLVQECSAGDSSVTMTFHTRFAFAK